MIICSTNVAVFYIHDFVLVDTLQALGSAHIKEITVKHCRFRLRKILSNELFMCKDVSYKQKSGTC